MAEIRISELTAKGSNLEATDLLEISKYNGSTYDTKSVTGAQIKDYATTIDVNVKLSDYTLALTDKDKLLELSNSGAQNITVPPNSSVAFPIGTQILFANFGSGLWSFVAGSGVTILSDGGKLKIASQYSLVTLIKRSTNTWYLSGNITT